MADKKLSPAPGTPHAPIHRPGPVHLLNILPDHHLLIAIIGVLVSRVQTSAKLGVRIRNHL